MSKGDVKKGAKLFKQKCEQCHSVIAADGNKQGPNLHGVVGRKAGTVAGFDYTAANKSSGITWTEAELLDYLKDPKKKIPEIGRAVQQECRDRSRMPSSA
eukprot:TRINITY_DN1637_c0_g1_i14.p1 TRINITY_DN1637_c0_g1~~TRINITY_DN1637_c0_g1_i14.p1  ORF type:complete len:100 (-),score=20.01 TRINITY_DN1637_c0_g1_i14:21-320(-)